MQIFLVVFMFPSFVLLGKEIGTYTVMATAGILIAGWFACRMAKRRGLDPNDMLVTLLIAAIGVLLGSHLLYGLTNLPTIVALIRSPGRWIPFSACLQWLFYLFGGSVFYGGLLGGSAAAAIYLRHKGLPLGPFGDIAAPAIALFHCFGRIGCFLGGCCYGVEVSWGITYPHALIPQANGVPRLPVQLIESRLQPFVILPAVRPASPRPVAQPTAPALLQHLSGGTVCARVLSGRCVPGVFGSACRTSQWISLLLLLVSLVIWIVHGARGRPGAPHGQPIIKCVRQDALAGTVDHPAMATGGHTVEGNFLQWMADGK